MTARLASYNVAIKEIDMRIWILPIATVAVLVGAVEGVYWYGGRSADESALVLNTPPPPFGGALSYAHVP